MQLVRNVGKFKKKHNMKPLAESRWEQVLRSKIKAAKSLHLNQKTIVEFYNLIHKESLKIESC